MNARVLDTLRLPNAWAVLSITMLVGLLLGCGRDAESEVPIRKIFIVDQEPFTVVAEVSRSRLVRGPYSQNRLRLHIETSYRFPQFGRCVLRHRSKRKPG